MTGPRLVWSALLAVSAAALGCGGSEPSGDAPSDEHLDRLRSLPYAGSTPAAPGEATGVVFHDPQRTSPGFTLYAVQMLALAELIDERGNVLRSWHDPHAVRWERAELLDDGDLLAIGVDRSDPPAKGIPDDRRYLARFDSNGNLRFKRYLEAHHDVGRTPDGNLLLLTFKRRGVPEIDREVDVRDDQLTLLDGEGRVLEELSLLEAFAKRPDLLALQPVRPNTLGIVPWVDLFHSNSAEWMDSPGLAGTHPIFDSGNVLVSLRHQNAVAVIDWARRELVWAWGRGELEAPHDARLLPNGHLLIFDNGLARGWSRVVEVDPTTREIVWQYRASDPGAFYTRSKGSSQRLPNGNTLIADSDAGRAFEVTPSGETVWEFLCPHEVAPGHRAAIVRAVRYEHEWIEQTGLLR